MLDQSSEKKISFKQSVNSFIKQALLAENRLAVRRVIRDVRVDTLRNPS